MSEKERYATINKWARVLQEEGADIHLTTVRKKIARLGIKGETGRDHTGRIYINGYYSESAVREACADLLEDLPKVDDSGFVEMDGEKYSTIYVLTQTLGISGPSITGRIRDTEIRSIKGRSKSGSVLLLYSESDICQLCSDVLAEYPQSDDDGFIDIEGKRYGSLSAFSRLFGGYFGTISRKVKEAQLPCIKGRDTMRRVINFYLESDVLSLCDAYVQELPQAGEDGFVDIDGVRHGTVYAFSKLYDLTPSLIASRVEAAKISPVRARQSKGQIRQFFSEVEIERICSELFEGLQKADDNGFITIDGDKYGTTGAWERLFGIEQQKIRSWVGIKDVKAIKGISKTGNVRDFYHESGIRALIKSHTSGEHIGGKKLGYLERNGQRYGTMKMLARDLKVSLAAIQTRVEKLGLVPIEDEMGTGKMHYFYSESEVAEALTDHLQHVPVADSEGFIEQEGQRFGTNISLARLLGISTTTIKKRLENSNCRSIKGRTATGTIYDHFLESDVRTACADLIMSMPAADEEGFFEKDGEVYGMMYSWSKRFPIPHSTLRLRFRSTNPVPIEGKASNGNVCNFFSETDVRAACSDLLEDIPREDENGIIEQGGERYATLPTLAVLFGISIPSITSRIRKASPSKLKGRVSEAGIEWFYCESDVRSLCSELLRDLPRANEDGFIEKDGKWYGVAPAFARNYGTRPECVRKRLGKQQVIFIEGRDFGGRIFKYFLKSDVDSLCADLIAKKSKK